MRSVLDGPKTIFQWVVSVLFWAVFFYFLWWKLGFSALIEKALFISASALLPLLMDSTVAGITLQPDGSWKVKMALEVVGAPTAVPVYTLDTQILLRATLAMPFTLALLLSVGAQRLWRVPLAVVAFAFIALITAAVTIGGTAMVIVNGYPPTLDDALLPQPPGYEVAVAAYGHWQYLAVQFLAYFFVIVVPLVSPMIILVTTSYRQIQGIFFGRRELCSEH